VMLVCIGATMVGSIILTNCEAGTEVMEQSFWFTLIFLGLRADLF
jgi:phosphatidylserine decarboxylase